MVGAANFETSTPVLMDRRSNPAPVRWLLVLGVQHVERDFGAYVLAFVGFGDFPLADAVRPPVTVIDQNPARLGRLAIERLLGRIENPGKRFKRRNILGVELIERQSCTPGSDHRCP